MSRKHSVLTALVTVALAVVMTIPASPQTRKWTIGVSQCNLGEPWRVQMNADIRKAADEHPELEMVFKDAQNDNLRQGAHVEEFIRAGVDLIIISPKEAAPLTRPVRNAFKEGIPVIVLDRRVLGNDFTCFIGADNRRIGKAAGTWIARRLGGKGKVVELKGLMTSTPGQDRNAGFREGIKGSAVEVIFEADMKWLEPDARKEMESALARFSEIDLVYAHNDPGAHGAYLAARAAGRERSMLFVGIDALPHEGQMYVKQGVLAATFEYPTGGKEAIETARAILSGKKVAREITLKSRVFTRENIDKGGGMAERVTTTIRERTMKHAALLLVTLFLAGDLMMAQQSFNGLGMGMGNLSRLSKAKTRSISPENFTGEKGKGGMATEGTGANAARDLGRGWKISPSVKIKAKETFTVAEIKGEGAIQQIWMTPTGQWRYAILRIYWDGESHPSVEVPVGDFFACGWGQYAQISSLAVCVNPGSAFNCYWEMPFRKSARITLENIAEDEMVLYYQINYTLTDVSAGCGVLPCSVPAGQPPSVQISLHHPRRCEGVGTVCGHLYGVGREQSRLVGRRRNQILSGWRYGLSNDLRHRYGRLLLRFV